MKTAVIVVAGVAVVAALLYYANQQAKARTVVMATPPQTQPSTNNVYNALSLAVPAVASIVASEQDNADNSYSGSDTPPWAS